MKKIFGLLSLLITYSATAQDITLPSTNYENQYQSSLSTGLVTPSIPLFSLETASPDLRLNAKFVFNSVLLQKNGSIAEGAKSYFSNGWEINIIPAINKMIPESGGIYSNLEDEAYFTNPMGIDPSERPERLPNIYAFDAFGIHGKFYFEEVNNQMVIKVIQASEHVEIDADFTYVPSSSINAKFDVTSFTITDLRGIKYKFSTLQITRYFRDANVGGTMPTGDFYGIFNVDYKKSFLLTKVTDKFNTTLLEYNYGSYEDAIERGSDEYPYDQLYLQNIVVNGIGEVHFNLDQVYKRYLEILIENIYTGEFVKSITFSNNGQIIIKTNPFDPEIEKKYSYVRYGNTLEIRNPTGGKTKYVFEENDYGFLTLPNNTVIPGDFSFENTYDEEVNITKTVAGGYDKFSFTISNEELQESKIYLSFYSRDPFWVPGLPLINPPIYLLKPNTTQSLHTINYQNGEINITQILDQYKSQFPGNVFYLGGGTDTYSNVKVIKRTTFTDTPDIHREEWNGMRIKSIQQLNENNQIVAEKQFIYTMPDEPNRSSGQTILELTINQHSAKAVPPYSGIPQTYFYRYVTVKEEGKGKTVHSFDDSPKGLTRNYYIMHSLSRIPSKEFKYDENNNLLEKTVTTFYIDDLDLPEYMLAEAEPILEKLDTTAEVFIAGSSTKKITTITESVFNPVTRLMSNRKITDVRLTQVFEEEHQYQKLGDVYYQTAIKKYKNGTMINQSKAEYAPINSGTLANVYALEKSAVAKATQPFEIEKEITKRDNKGNILEYKTKEGLYVSQIWGYNDTKVVAELKNQRYAQIASGTISTIKNNSKSTSYNETSLTTALNGLRTTYPNAFITTYTYIPMVGLKTTTDANGRKETYQYDNFNRLYRVLNHEGNIVKEYHYNIKN